MALVTHEAFLCYIIDFLLIVTTQETDEIHRRIFEILLLDIHRARIQAQAAAGTCVNLGLGHTLSRMTRLETGIAQQYPQHLGKDMHVTAERHCGEKQAKTDGISPPDRHEEQFVAENQMPQMVHRNSQEASAAEIGRKALCQKPQRENQPKAVQGDSVSQRRLRGMTHAEDDGPEPLENRHAHTGKHIEQEEVHQEKEEPSSKRDMTGIDPDEEPVENRIEKAALSPRQMLRNEQCHFEMSQDNEHEPSEGNRRVHVAQKRLAFPDFRMEKTVAEQVLDIFKSDIRDEQRLPETTSVLGRNLGQQPDEPGGQPYQHETDADHERNHEVAVTRRDSVNDLRRSL